MQETEDKTKIRTRLLSNRNIGRHYHYQSLTTYGDKIAAKVLDKVTNYSVEDYTLGKGFTFIGDGGIPYDLTMLTCRGLILRGFEFYCFQLSDLINSDGELIQVLAEKSFPPLCITNFNPDSSRYDTKSYTILESVLQRRYLDEDIPLIVHFPVEHVENGNNVLYGDLVTNNFMDKLSKKNIKVVTQ